MAKVTLKQLGHAKACDDQVEFFKQMFGEETEVTPEKCLEVYDKFDWDWAARYLLTPSNREDYRKAHASARKEYEKARNAAWKECEKVRDAARDKYKNACYSALEECKKISATALKEYEKARDSALEEYEKTLAKAFGAIYSNQQT